MVDLAYVTSDGERVELDSPSSSCDGLEIRGREWSYSIAGRIVKGIAENAVKASVRWACRDPEAADAAFAAFDRDAMAGKPGKVVSRGWERPAYCLETAVRGWHGPSGSLVADLGFVLVGSWRRFSSRQFLPVPPLSVFGFPFGYPHGYGYDGAMMTVDTGADTPCRARLIVYGPVSSPRIVIGGNAYEVHADIPKGAHMVIDGMERTVETVLEDGTVRDDFAKAERGGGEGSGSYIFEPIKPGPQRISWAGSYGVDVGWWHERMALPWAR